MNNKRIFIGGPMRSGTTLMLYILNKHPEIGIIGETKLFELFNYGERDINKLSKVVPFYSEEGSNIYDVKDYIVFLQEHINEWKKYDSKDLLAILSNSFKNNDPKSILESLFSFLYPDKKIVGEKTPVHVFHYKTIRRYYPESYFIQMIRNPFSTSLSAVKAFSNGGVLNDLKTLIPHCRRWNKIAELGKSRELNDSKYKVVEFEKLIDSPSKEIQKICNFLDVEFNSNMLEIKKVNSSFENNYQSDKSFSKDANKRYENNNKLNKYIIKLMCNNKKLYNY